MIEFESVSFRYSGSRIKALDEIDLEIDQGEYLLISGRSGSGKSTMLRCMNGLVPQFHGGYFQGRVIVDGLDTLEHSVRELSRSVGLVFQDPENQFVTTSVRSEIAFGQENLNTDPGLIRKKTLAMAESFDLEGVLDRAPDTLSGGEKQKAIIASLAAMEPDVLVLDEPTSQLDPRSSDQIFSMLKYLHNEGTTIVLSEHRLSRVLPHVSRVIILDGGEIVGDGRPEEISGKLAGMKKPRPTTDRKKSRIGAPKLEARSVSFRYQDGDEWVLRKVDLDILESEVLAVLGENGSGKTTLAKIAAGLLDPQGGTVKIDGGEPRKGRVAMVFQDPNKHLFHETVMDEVAFARRNMDVDGPGLDRILERMNLEGLSHRNPRDLSGGQKEKVAMASVLSYEPDILIMDEPTRGLDAIEKARIIDLNRNIMLDRKLSVMVLSHDLDFVEAFADRAVVISGGKIILEGGVDTIVEGFRELLDRG